MSNLIVNTPVGLACHYTNYEYELPPHILYINDLLLDVFAGKFKRIIVTLPPRHGKSDLIASYFASWYLLNSTNKQVMFLTHTQDYANIRGYKVRDIIREMGPYWNVKFANDSKAKHRFDLSNGCFYNAMGISGNVTGKGGNLLIVDDPIKNDEEVHSKAMRDKAWDIFNKVAFTRLAKDAAIFVIMTRWHYDDIVGRIIKNTPDKWKIVNLPAFAEDDDLLGRNIGEALWEDRFDKDTLTDIKEQIGSYAFNSLYQQRPVANENQIIKSSWIKYYHNLPNSYMSGQSWDTAFEENSENDYSVGITGYLCDDGIYIHDVVRRKMEFPELVRSTIDFYNQYRTRLVFVEDKGSGISLKQTIRKSTVIPIKPVKPEGSKLLRLNAVSPYFEAGKVYFNKNIPNLKDLLDELFDFPYAPHDDFVDALTQLISNLTKYLRIEKRSRVFIPGASITKKSNFYETN